MRYTDLERTLNALEKTDPREAAEYAYALAILYMRAGDNERAAQFGRKSIALFNQCRMETQKDCAARNIMIGGVLIPGLIHQDVVRDRLRSLSL